MASLDNPTGWLGGILDSAIEGVSTYLDYDLKKTQTSADATANNVNDRQVNTLLDIIQGGYSDLPSSQQAGIGIGGAVLVAGIGFLAYKAFK